MELQKNGHSLCSFLQGFLPCHNSKKVTTHPDIAHPRQSPYPTMKGFPLQPVGKGFSGCVPVRCVEATLEQPEVMELQECWQRFWESQVDDDVGWLVVAVLNGFPF